MLQPRLLYAQVVKSYRRQRIVGVQHRVVFGARETLESILEKRSWKINTSFIERLNLDFRQHVAAIGRRVNTLCKHKAGLRQQLAIFHTRIITLCCPTPACACPAHVRDGPRDGSYQAVVVRKNYMRCVIPLLFADPAVRAG